MRSIIVLSSTSGQGGRAPGGEISEDKKQQIQDLRDTVRRIEDDSYLAGVELDNLLRESGVDPEEYRSRVSEKRND